AMCCTFGDLTDVTWWRDLQLPTRSVITHNGRLQAEAPQWLEAEGAQGFYQQELAGKTTFSARKATVEALAGSGDLLGNPNRCSGRPTSSRRATSPWRSSRPGSGTSATAAAMMTCAPR